MADSVRSGRVRRADAPSHNSIACEPCRAKKRRCDRSLPVCLRCNGDPSLCHYPEQNKRGLPLGYVNRLEARLAETEAALLYVLGHKHRGDASASSEDSSNLGPATLASASNLKTDRIQEWDRLPLQSATDVQAWYRWKTSDSTLGSPPPTAPGSTASQTAQASQGIRRMTSNSTASAHQAWLEAAESSQAAPAAAMTTPAAPSEALSEPLEVNSGRAKRLSESQKRLYF